MNKIITFNGGDLINILISGLVIYIILILYIRFFGKRATSELNSFDWIVTVSVGSIFASTVIIKEISLIEGASAMLFLLWLQYLSTLIIKKSKSFRKVIKSSPHLLLFEGEFIDENLRQERILKAEIYAEIRQKGLKSIKQIYAIVLETNSKISVIPNNNSEEIGFSLSDVLGLPEGLKNDLKNNTDTLKK